MKMALIKCPECCKEISDKASACPNCGCPIEADESGFAWHEDRVEEKKIMSIENNNIFYIVGIIFAVCLVLMFIAEIISNVSMFLWVIFFAALICYLPLLFAVLGRELYFTNKRIVGKIGIFFDKRVDVPLDMITGVTVAQGVFGDTLLINTMSGGYRFNYVNNATAFQSALLRQMGTYKKNY